MAYKFRLETLLTMRRRLFEIAEGELARIFKEMAMIRESLQAVTLHLDTAKHDLEERLSGGLIAEECQFRTRHIQVLSDEREEYAKRLVKLEMEILRARHNLSLRHREKELIENFRQKDYAVFLAEMQRMEQKEADDLSSMRYVRKEEIL